ncbi:unnamed protein product [Amoebophrya sp. A25]|nr:unnamed protein product [Amoebophrya sp. A25]|eukprot:GSA25T00027519001.1
MTGTLSSSGATSSRNPFPHSSSRRVVDENVDRTMSNIISGSFTSSGYQLPDHLGTPSWAQGTPRITNSVASPALGQQQLPMMIAAQQQLQQQAFYLRNYPNLHLTSSTSQFSSLNNVDSYHQHQQHYLTTRVSSVGPHTVHLQQEHAMIPPVVQQQERGGTTVTSSRRPLQLSKTPAGSHDVAPQAQQQRAYLTKRQRDMQKSLAAQGAGGIS